MKLIICPVFYSTILHLGLGDNIMITLMSINMIHFGQYNSVRTRVGNRKSIPILESDT